MFLTYKQISFGGLKLDGFHVYDGSEYIGDYLTPCSVAKGLNKPTQAAIDYLRRNEKEGLGIDVQVLNSAGKYHTVKAYPVSVISLMIYYWAVNGDRFAWALVLSTLQVDMMQTLKGTKPTNNFHQGTPNAQFAIDNQKTS